MNAGVGSMISNDGNSFLNHAGPDENIYMSVHKYMMLAEKTNKHTLLLQVKKYYSQFRICTTVSPS